MLVDGEAAVEEKIAR